jgi:enoyl-CoA hydratase
MTPTGLVRVAVEAGVATLTLDDPNRRNTISNALNAAVIQAVDACEADPEVRALVVTGAGSAFCAGADLEDLRSCETDDRRGQRPRCRRRHEHGAGL